MSEIEYVGELRLHPTSYACKEVRFQITLFCTCQDFKKQLLVVECFRQCTCINKIYRYIEELSCSFRNDKLREQM